MTMPIYCPVCHSTLITQYSDQGEEDEEEMLLAPGEACGVVFDETKTGCYDWQFVVVAWTCDSGHVFFVPKE